MLGFSSSVGTPTEQRMPSPANQQPLTASQQQQPSLPQQKYTSPPLPSSPARTSPRFSNSFDSPPHTPSRFSSSPERSPRASRFSNVYASPDCDRDRDRDGGRDPATPPSPIPTAPAGPPPATLSPRPSRTQSFRAGPSGQPWQLGPPSRAGTLNDSGATPGLPLAKTLSRKDSTQEGFSAWQLGTAGSSMGDAAPSSPFAAKPPAGGSGFSSGLSPQPPQGGAAAPDAPMSPRQQRRASGASSGPYASSPYPQQGSSATPSPSAGSGAAPPQRQASNDSDTAPSWQFGPAGSSGGGAAPVVPQQPQARPSRHGGGDAADAAGAATASSSFLYAPFTHAMRLSQRFSRSSGNLVGAGAGGGRCSFAMEALPQPGGSETAAAGLPQQPRVIPSSWMGWKRSFKTAVGPPSALHPLKEGSAGSLHEADCVWPASGGQGGMFAADAAPKAAAPIGLAGALDPLADYQPPAGLEEAYGALGALVPDTQVPLQTLQWLWACPCTATALQVAERLAHEGVLLLVGDPSSHGGGGGPQGLCALPEPDHLLHSATCWPEAVMGAHGELLHAYLRNGSSAAAAGRAFVMHEALVGLRDDGYILKALPHHLLGSGHHEALHALMTDPAWLERKLYACGSSALVADFRECLLCWEGEDDDRAEQLKLILQAIQLSLGTVRQLPTVRLLREQMLGRLVETSNAPESSLKGWFDEQLAQHAADSWQAAGSRVLHLMPRTPALTQAGGVHRMTLRSRGDCMRRALILPNSTHVITTSPDGVAQLYDMNIGDCETELRAPAPISAEAVSADCSAAVLGCADGTVCVWDLGAGRFTHMMRGHSARVTCVAMDRQGVRCVTASEDRTGRIWNLKEAECEGLLIGHGTVGDVAGALLDACISSDGMLAVTASDDNTARVWDLDEDGEPMYKLAGHTGWVTSCAFIGTSHNIVTASHDMCARIWDALKGRCLHVLEGHTGRINRVVTDPGGRWAVTASDDTTARVWDAEEGTLVQVLAGHEGHVSDAAITRDGLTVVTASGDQRGAVWDVLSGRPRAWLDGHSGELRSVALTARGRFAVTAAADGTARVWDLCAPPVPGVARHAGRVLALQATPGGRLVFSSGDDGRVLVWEAGLGICLRQHDGHGAGVRFMAVAADGKHVVTGSADRKVCKWNWEARHSSSSNDGSGRDSIDTMQECMLRSAMHSVQSMQSLCAAAGSVPGRSGSNSRPSADELATDDLAAMLLGPGKERERGSAQRGGLSRGGLAALAGLAAGNGNSNGSGSSNSSAMGYCAASSLARHASLMSLTDFPRTSSSLSWRTRASIEATLGETIAAQGEALRSSVPAAPGARVKHMAFDAACRTGAVLLYDSTVGMYDLDTGHCMRQLIRRGERDAVRSHTCACNAVMLSRDGSRVITLSKDHTARIWDVATGATLWVLQGHTDAITLADLSPDESLLATASYDKTVRITRMNGAASGRAAGGAAAAAGAEAAAAGAAGAAAGQQRPASGGGAPAGLAVLEHPTPATHLSFSPDGRRLAVALEDKTVILWDLHKRMCLPALTGHSEDINALAWSPDSRYLLTGSQDCTLRAWDAASGAAYALFAADAAVTSCCFAGREEGVQSDTIVAGDAAGCVHFLDFPPELQGA